MFATKRHLFSMLALSVLLLCSLLYVYGGFSLAESDSHAKITFISTQEDADCVVIQQDEDVILIDTGEAADGPHIADVLHEQGVQKISCLILTHMDKDHMGGAFTILNTFEVKQIIVPYYAKENALYEKLVDEINGLNIPLTIPALSKRYFFGNMCFTVYPPLEANYSSDNNYSLGILLTHQDVKLFFAGDAEKKRTEELLKMNLPNVDLYKVAHHGRANLLSRDLVEALSPTWALITAETADSAVVEALEEQNSKILYRTMQDYLFVSDGETLTLLSE